jgi:hypothetical protein
VPRSSQEPAENRVKNGAETMASSDCLCLMLGIECWCTRPGPRGYGYRPHGTLAAARRHYRREGPGWQCRACRQAEAADHAARAATRPSRSKAAVAARQLAAVQAERRAILAAALPSCNQYHRGEAA